MYTIVQVAPITIISPARVNIAKFTVIAPNRCRPIDGTMNQTISASPAAVRTTRLLAPSASASRATPRITSETPKPSVTAFLALIPLRAIE